MTDKPSTKPNTKPSTKPNDKVYIHEFIDIRGQHRADYVYHMTANYSPIAQEERGQQCYGVWGVVGSTGRWPQVVNLWEENGFDGLAASFAHEFGRPAMQDPKLARWWAEAATYRSGGTDRILVPAPWTRTIGELVAAGVRGEVYAHEQITVPLGAAAGYLDRLGEAVAAGPHPFGWQLAGAWRTALADDSECFVLWAIPSWAAWAAVELVAARRTLLVDAPLAPMRVGRQPARTDRVRPYQEV
jgi:hypothetical protein